MLRLAGDADFDGDVLRALRRLQPDIDLVRVIDVGLRTAPDPDVLAWAASQGRILLTHDENTMIAYAKDRVATKQPMPGVLVVPQSPAIGAMAREIQLVALCSEQDEWRDQIQSLPL